VDICLENNQDSEAAKYIPKIPEPNIRADLYVRVGMYKEAADVGAKEMKDIQYLSNLRNKCTNREVQSYIDRLVQSLSQKS